MNRMMKESTLPFMNMQATSSKSNVPDLDFEDTSTRQQATSRVFKKSSANGKITVYLGKRDFVDHITHVDPIDGVVLIDPGYVSNRKVFVQILAAFRYGREDLDVLGLSFRKDLFMTSKQVCPASSNEDLDKPLTKLQERLIKKLGPNAKPFIFEVPPLCPSSVTLQPTPGDTSKPCGVDYELTAYIGNNSEDKAQKKNTVGLSIRKIIYAPSKQDGEQPSVEVTKEFMLKPNKIHLEASLDRELYHHGESLSVNVHIANNSSKTVKKIKVSVRQFADICLFSTAQYKCTVAEVESDDGCQVQPGFTLSKVFKVTPLLMNNKDKWGLALDGQLKDEDTNLASSTFIADHTQRESLGIIVQYKVRVKLFMSPFGGELVAELPFILMHPKPYGLNDMDLICKEFISPSKGTSIKSNRSSFNSINVIAKPEVPDLIEIEADEETVFENLALKRM